MRAHAGTPAEVLWVALKLGVTAFGGPVAHLGYFERAYVRDRRWVNVEEFAGLVSVCQLLPGPTSSQVGFLIGFHRAGWPGALGAWVGFTLPSTLIMYLAAVLAPSAAGQHMHAVIHGLLLTAVAVVARAVVSMATALAPDAPRQLLAIASAVLMLCEPTWSATLLLAGGGAIGAVLCRSIERSTAIRLPAMTQRAGGIAFAMFVAIFVVLTWVPVWRASGTDQLVSIFFRSGTLIFGGGHVVLPVLQQTIAQTHWISEEHLLTGYGLAQVIPGPLFTVATYLGAAGAPPHQSLSWSLLATAAIFLPGLLLCVAGLALAKKVTVDSRAWSVVAGVNAVVVGLLAAALYDPIWVHAVHSLTDVLVATAGFLLLHRTKAGSALAAACSVAIILGQQILCGSQ